MAQERATSFDRGVPGKAQGTSSALGFVAAEHPVLCVPSPAPRFG